jgi:hypothetical protein
MQQCDHGIAFDRWCGECEWDFLSQADPEPDDREWSRWASVLAAIGLVVLVVIAAAATR